MKKEKSENNFHFFLIGIFVGLLILGGWFLVNLSKRFVPNNYDWEQILPTPADYPRNSSQTPLPQITANSLAVIDIDSGAVLWEKNSQIATSPASTTKMMTALISLENFRLDQILTVGDLSKVEGQKIKLIEGEKLTVENLLYGLLVASANDAAIVLAQNFPGGEQGFVWAMNQKAVEMGFKNTHFTNPVGYDDTDHYSSALDLGKIAILAIKNPEIANIVATEKITISDVTGKIQHPITNVNTLIGKLPGVKGIKTGWTQIAGECLVSLIERDGHRVVVSLLGSKDRFKETREIINWVFENFVWELPPR